MLIDAKQLHIARHSLGLSLRDLAKASGLSAGGISQIERTGEFQGYSMRALQQTLVDKGAIFGTDGAVAIKMEWQEPVPTDAAVRVNVLRFLNAARKRDGKCPLVDGEGS